MNQSNTFVERLVPKKVMIAKSLRIKRFLKEEEKKLVLLSAEEEEQIGRA